METAFREMLNRMKYFFENYKDIPDEKLHEECMKNFVDLTPLITASKDDEVLVELLTFFEEEFDYEFEGVCEDLESQIDYNFTSDQIIAALYKKFDYLANNDMMRCKHLSEIFFNLTDMREFDKFRNMFNTVKSNKSAEFLSRIDGICSGEFKEEIALLREDMKKW